MSLEKICFFYSHPLAVLNGGTERVTKILAEEFERRGHEVVFLAFEKNRYKNSLPRQFYISDVNVLLELEEFLSQKNISFLIYQDGAVQMPFSRLRNTKVISVLHYLPDFYPPESLWSKVKKLLPPPLRFLNLAFKFPGVTECFRYLLLKRIGSIYRKNLRISDRFVLLSPAFLPEFFQIVRKNDQEIRAKVRAIPNPASFSAADNPLSEKKRELLFVGRLENGQKRVDLLLRIWARLEARFPEWRLRVVGDGPDAGKLWALTGTLGLTRVSFEGFRNPAPFYRDAAIFCMTSAFEGFPMVLLEAAAYACVPVAFDSYAAVRDVLDDCENGVLVPAFDCDAYAETLSRLMRDAAARERLALAVRSRVSDFSADKIAARWESLFAEIS